MSARRWKLARKSVRCHHPEPLEARLLLAEIAETLLVSVDATGLPEGQVTSIPNAGTLTGVFEPTGGNAATVPVIGKPVATATSGTSGIRLDGNDFLQLLQSTGGDILPAPDGISGPNPTRSVEAWVWNPAIRDEETILSWGRRGGPDGTNVSFNYGANGAFGAVGHWGAPDIGWGTVPTARNWHHLVYTFDGTTSTTRVYVDGVQTNTEVLAANAINTPLATPINIGTQTAIPAGGTVPQPSDPALRGSLTIGRIRIHDGVLSPTQIQTNFNTEKADFVEPVIPGVPPPPLVKLVDVDPTTQPEGPVTSLTNTGTAGGFFAPTGGDPNTVPVIDQPVATATGGTVGIRMDGTDFLQHVDAAVDGAPVPSPDALVGPDPKRSIEVWAWNPALATEESMVAWGRRGTDGGNMSFNYGSSGGAGAVTHFGQADIGWGATRPPAGQWHHLVYTYDGTTTRVYSDGVLINSEFIGEQALNTIAGSPISLGTQYGANGAPAAANRASLTLGRVRVYSGILTPEQIQADYNAEKAGYIEPSGIPPPPPPAPLSAPPIHRYSFTNPAGPATDGQEIIDSIGGANGNVRGTGATWNATGTRLVLPGGSSATAPFVDLPNGLLSSMGVANEGTGKLSIEGWAKQTASRTWSRFFDFGSSVAGELSAPGGTGNGVDYFMLSQNGGDTTLHRFELTDNAGNPANRIADFTTATFNTDLHYVATWDEETGEVHLYEQGIEVANYVSPTRMSAINDVNNWLGRSQYTGDLNFQGEFDEFRIYDHVLTEAEVRGNLQAGPNVVTGGSPTVSDVFVRGTQWAAAFKTYLETKGLGDDVYGYRVFGTGSNASDVLPWINVDEVVLKYAAAPTGSGIPTAGTVTFTSANGQTYTATAVTPVTGDPTAFVVTLSQPLGGGNPTTGVAPTPAQNGDRITVGVPGGGPAGTNFSYRMNVLQGDTDHTGETGGEHSVLAADFSAVKKKFFKDTTSPVTGTDVDYSVFHDVNGSGSILANDFSEVKKRFFQNLAAPPAAAAPLILSGVSKDLFSSSAIL